MKPRGAVPDVDVLVVGGGIAGLTTAHDLVRAGHRVLLCEARNRLGGLVHTERLWDCVVEAGPDSMLAQKPAGLALCEELGLDQQLVSTLEPRTAYVLRGEDLHPIPREAVLGLPLTAAAIDACGMLSPHGRATLARDLTAPSCVPAPAGDESVGAFMRRRFGLEAVQFLAQPLLGGIHAGDVDRLSMRALFPAIAAADQPGVSLLGVLAARRAPPDTGGAFRSLRGGMTTLIDALAAGLPTRARVLTTVNAIRHGTLFEVETCAGSFSAAAIVLAVPAWEAARLLASLDVELAQQLAQIAYGSTATITLAYRRHDVGHALQGSGFVVPRQEPATRLLAASWITSKWPDRAPDGIALVRAFAGGVLDEDLLAADDAGLAALAHRDLAPLLQIRDQPLFTRVYRWPNASPQYTVGHAARVAAIEERAARLPGLWLTGNALRGVGIPDCIADARATAARARLSLAASGG